jgi:hypothetical protein
MSIIGIILTVLVIAVVFYCINLIPFDPPILKKVLNILLSVLVFLWFLSLFGLLPATTIHLVH